MSLSAAVIALGVATAFTGEPADTSASIVATTVTEDVRQPTPIEAHLAHGLRMGADVSWALPPDHVPVVTPDAAELHDARSIIGLADVARRRALDRDPAVAASLKSLETLALAEMARRAIADEIHVTDQDVASAIKVRKGRYDEYRLSHIFVAIDESRLQDNQSEQEDRARARAAAILNRLVKGEDFAAMASVESGDRSTSANGGELSSMFGVYMAPEFLAAVSQLKSGALSDPVRGPGGFHIIRLDQRIVATVQSARYLVSEDIRKERLPLLIEKAVTTNSFRP